VAVALNEGEALAILGLRASAASADIDAAHRRLASRAHPDRWLDAPEEDRDAAQARFDEVNAAYRLLRGTSHRRDTVAPPRRRPTPEPAPERPRPAAPPTGRAVPEAAAGVPDEETDRAAFSKGLMAAGIVALVFLLVVIGIGLGSSSPDGARQRSVLGPLAYQLWEAERTGAFGHMWDLSDAELHGVIGRESYIAHLELCPPIRPPRDVARIAKLGNGLWEVEWVDPAGQPGLTYFRQVGDYRFAAASTDPVLLDFLRAPLERAGDEAWCRR
jgi:hypothetical protein